MSIDLSLDRINTLLTHLPKYTRPTIHVAGTNGKGSVSSLVSSILLASSVSVGKFNSPHLVSVLDSITINGKPVHSEPYSHARRLVEQADAEHSIGATSFELLTSTALAIFEHAQVEVVVLEVGLGGRLDATNVVADDRILVSALTAVDLDHQAFLGSTVNLIAREKAGIARRGVPFVLGPQKHVEVIEVVRETVALAGADLVVASPAAKREAEDSADGHALSASYPSFRRPPPQHVLLSMTIFADPIPAELPLYGDHQLDNLGVAARVIDVLLTHPSSLDRLSLRGRITPSSVAIGIRDTTWPGRLSFHDIPTALYQTPSSPPAGLGLILADGAHNPSSSATLATFLSHLLTQVSSPKIQLTFVLALSHSPPKTPLQTLSPLFAFSRPNGVDIRIDVAVLRFTPVEGMPWLRSVPPSDLRDVVGGLVPGAEIWSKPDDEDPRDGHVAQALQWACRSEAGVIPPRLIVLAGSLYLAADFYRWLQSEA